MIVARSMVLMTYLVLFVSIMNSVAIMSVSGGAALGAFATPTHLLHPGLTIGIDLAADRVGGTHW